MDLDAPDTPIRLTLIPTGAIEGAVVGADPDAPSEPITVHAFHDSATVYVESAMTDQTGRFAFAALPAGDYALSMTTLLDGRRAPAIRVTVVANQTIPAELVLGPATGTNFHVLRRQAPAGTVLIVVGCDGLRRSG